MATLWTRVSNLFKLGKGRYYIGKDLAANKYYEFPALDGSTDPRKTRRLVQYREHKELGEHDQGALPVQWLMWLRHTRRSAPTIEELEQDIERIRITQHNARVLEARDAERRMQLESRAAEQAQRMRIEAESPQGRHPAAASQGAGASPHDPRRTAVPTSSVSDIDADAERKERVGREEQVDPETFVQERKVDMEVWEASRRRVEAQQQQQQNSQSEEQDSRNALREARDRRSLRRAELDKRDMERERARRLMSQSPLSAFDVSVLDDKQQRQGSTSQRPPPPLRPGRPSGANEGWTPQSWSPQPSERK